MYHPPLHQGKGLSHKTLFALGKAAGLAGEKKEQVYTLSFIRSLPERASWISGWEEGFYNRPHASC